MKIFINPGHGGTAPGAISVSGVKEADITLKVANILADLLQENNFEFCFYQQKKYLSEVVKEENKSGANLFISIHCNAAKNLSANGVEVLFQSNSSKGKNFASSMQKTLIQYTGLRDRGIKPRADVFVLNKTKAPAILIELAFLSNPIEENMLLNETEIFAYAIFEAIKEFYNKGLI